MKKTLISIALMATSQLALADNQICNYTTDYDINLNDNRVLFTNTSGDSYEFTKDSLLINGKKTSLTDEQISAVTQVHQETGQLLPEIAYVAIEGAELGISAATIVVTSLFGEDEAAANELIAPIKAAGEKIKLHVTNSHLNTQELEKALESAFDEEFEQLIEKAVTKYSGKIIGNILSAVMSGDEEEVRDFEFRMETMERDIEKYVESNAKELETRADALCDRIASLEKLDAQLELIEDYPEKGLIYRDGDGVKFSNIHWGD